jgi:DNA replication and repair protein RecF
LLLINKLVLNNFRNFNEIKLLFNHQFTLLFGNNGVGKTNILEALTLFGKTPSLRNSGLDEMVRSNCDEFSLYLELEKHSFIEKSGISFNKKTKKKLTQINGEILSPKKLGPLKNYLINFIWLTPQLESLFIASKQERRDYLDKIVADLDYNHNERINSYQKLLKERLAILQKYQLALTSNKWLEIVENKIVELGIIIATARVEALDFFNKAIYSFNSNFPKTSLEVIGDIESLIKSSENSNAIKIEEFYRQKLEQNRSVDLVSFKTNFGIHRSNFTAIFLAKNMPANLCSTGEQKSILISLTLARAKISAIYKNQPTILIFDEIASHLDNQRKSDLFNEISDISIQCFFTATNKELIPDIEGMDIENIQILPKF